MFIEGKELVKKYGKGEATCIILAIHPGILPARFARATIALEASRLPRCRRR